MTTTFDAKERLKRAVTDLAEASYNQHVSFIKFTDNLDDLRFAIARLDHSCRTFQARSKSLSVNKLRRRSLRLARIMSSAET